MGMLDGNTGEAQNVEGQRMRTYPNPFLSYSTAQMPRSVPELLRWCEHLWYRSPTYAQAMKRMVRYFLTDVDITNCSDQQRKRVEKFLNGPFDVLNTAAALGDDYMAYANSFSSVYLPFSRFLACTECGQELRIDRVNYKFKDFKFIWKCGKCKSNQVTEKPIDRRRPMEEDIHVIRWTPHRMKIKEHPISGKCVYSWDPDPQIVKELKEGDPFTLETMPWDIVRAIQAGKLFQFNPGVVFHMRNKTLAGVDVKGWGIGNFLHLFSQAWYIQTLKLYNEVLAQEYIVPFRVISPAAPQAGIDASAINPAMFNGMVSQMLKQHRRNPGGWNFVGSPIAYQCLGGEGTQMITHDMIGAATDEMLNASGVPAEMYRGTMKFDVLPVALRTVQQTFSDYLSGINLWLSWLNKTVSTAMAWEGCDAKFKPVTLADDIENRQMVMSLATSQRIDMGPILERMGVDPDQDRKNRFRSQRLEAEAQMELSSDLSILQQQAQSKQSPMLQAAGVTGQPSQPSAGGSGGGTSLPQLTQQAEQLATKLLQIPYEQRKSEMLKLKQSDETLWSLVKAKMQLARQSQETQNEGQQQAQ